MRLRPAVLAAGFSLAVASCATPSGDRAGAAALAADRGCASCHAERTAAYGAPIPIAPSWQEIAARYRREPGAQEELAAVLVGGTEERHWKGSPFVTMLPQEKWVTSQEARELARWILAR